MGKERFQGSCVLSLKVADLGRKYESYRFVAPRIEEMLKRSLGKNGQLSPITVVEEESIYQILDGFKRARASEEVSGLESLEAKCMPEGSGKVMMLGLNLDRKGLDPVEEGLLMRAMHRFDGMTQSEIAGLIGRHRSWVCRRIALVERLDPKVVENLRLGLITPSQGRAMALLPRGNQAAVLEEVLNSGVTSRETEKLVKVLNIGKIYDSPQIRMELDKMRASKTEEEKKNPGNGKTMAGMLYAMKSKCRAVTEYLESHPEWMPSQAERVEAARDAAGWVAQQLDIRLEGNHGQ